MRIGEKSAENFNSISIIIEKVAYSDFVEYLKTHELDIASDFEDFGTLKSVFRCFMQRYPERK